MRIKTILAGAAIATLASGMPAMAQYGYDPGYFARQRLKEIEARERREGRSSSGGYSGSRGSGPCELIKNKPSDPDPCRR